MAEDKELLPSPATTTTSRQKQHVAFLIVASIVSSVVLILGNKVLIADFGFTHVLFLSAAHFFSCMLFLELLAYYRFFSSKRHMVPTSTGWVMSSFGCASIVFMNFNLKYNSVGVYQMSKLLCIPVIVMLQRFGHERKKISIEVVVSLLLTLVGVGWATVTDVSLNFLGSIYAVISVFSTARFQIWQGSKQKEFDLDALQIAHVMMPYQCVLTVAACFALELYPAFHAPPTDSTTLLSTIWTFSLVAIILLTCICAISVNLITYALIGQTSAVTYQVVGHLKTCLTLIGGYVLFPAPSDQNLLKQWSGMVVAIVGMVLYGDAKQKDGQQERKFVGYLIPKRFHHHQF